MNSLKTSLLAAATVGGVILLAMLGLQMISTATFILLGVVLLLPVGVALMLTNGAEPARGETWR